MMTIADFHIKHKDIIKQHAPLAKQLTDGRIQFRTEFVDGTKITTALGSLMESKDAHIAKLMQYMDLYNQI